MVAVNVRPSRAARHVDDGDIVLSNGRSTLLSSIPGGITWTRQKLDRLTNAVQAQTDDIWDRSLLPLDDPDRTMTAAEFTAIYGGRGILDPPDAASDTGNIIWRSTLVSFTFNGDDLVPVMTMVT